MENDFQFVVRLSLDQKYKKELVAMQLKSAIEQCDMSFVDGVKLYPKDVEVLKR